MILFLLNMDEKKFTTMFKGRFLEGGSGGLSLDCSYLFEYKVVKKGERLFRSQIKEHQVLELWRACGEDVAGAFGVYHKVSDSAIGYKPADAFYLCGEGWLVVGFVESRQCFGLKGDLLGKWWLKNKKGSLGKDYFESHGVFMFDW